jgi:hypothetical protein
MPHYVAGFISVAAIMPQAIGSGKPQRDEPERVFPLSGMTGYTVAPIKRAAFVIIASPETR